MFKQGFTVTGSSLKLLQPGERGVVSRLQGIDDRLSRQLREMGIRVGTVITLEQRFPRFRINVGSQSFAINNLMMNAIYVRLEKRQVPLNAQSFPKTVQSLQPASCPISPSLTLSSKL